MSTIQLSSRRQSDLSGGFLLSFAFRLIVLGLLDAGAVWFIRGLLDFGSIPLAVVIALCVLLINVVFLVERLYPLRWMAVGLALMLLFAIYPIFFTIYVAFTNYGDGHLLEKQQAIEQILKEKYLPEEGQAFSWTAYKSSDGEYLLWLIDAQGTGYLAKVGEPIRPVSPGEEGVGELDARGVPTEIEGFQRLSAIQLAAGDRAVTEVLFGDPNRTIQIRSSNEAAELKPLYTYDPEQDAMISNETGIVYQNVQGTFAGPQGQSIRPGFRETVGWQNFTNFFQSSALRGPLVRIITWNFAFAILSVLMTFSLGLAIALMFNDPEFPGRKLIRSFLLIPYTIPGLITILIWRGMLNVEFGVVNRWLLDWFNWAPPWTTDQWWAKIAILIVNLWLGYPYFMLITSGALQSIPTDIYEAAEVDGASPWQRFRSITLPLLLVAVGPLMIASFTFNFNNFNLIYLFIGGGPPIAGATTQAGHTDILISYVYNLAFAGGRGVNYGLASAVTIIIFIIVGVITLFQFRYTRMWEEVSENV